MLALAGLGVAAAWVPGIAQAGPARYVYEVCDSALPGGGSAGAHFTRNPGVAFAESNTCARPGGSLSIAEVGAVEASFAYWAVQITPPGTTVTSITFEGSACNVGGANRAFVGSEGFPASACAVNQVRRTTPALSIAFPLWIFLGCDGNIGPCGPGASVEARHIAATVVDSQAPTLGEIGGSLLSGAALHGHQSLAVGAHDEGGGLSAVAVTVNGLPAAAKMPPCNVAHTENLSVSGPVAVSPAPCPADARAEWSLDTEQYPFHDGVNSVEVCASDYSTLSAPNTTCSGPRTVDVDNSCTPSGIDGGASLSAHFTPSGSDSVAVGFNKAAGLEGRLTDDGGDPVAGATLCVKMRTAGEGAPSQPVGSLTTGADGRYTYEVPPGPNREVTIAYRHDARQVARNVTYYAHCMATLKLGPSVLRNGEVVHFWGRVPGPRAGGRIVVFQASPPGSRRWITFRRATSGQRGRFQADHRFTSTPTRTRFSFRVLVPAQSGYPWLQGRSRTASVLVEGE